MAEQGLPGKRLDRSAVLPIIPHMATALRKALFWVLMLVLPLQGIAAITMMPLHALRQGAAQMQEGSRSGAPSGMDAASMAHPSGDCGGMMAGCEHAHAPGLSKCGLSAVCGLVAAPALQLLPLLQVCSSQAPVARLLNVRVAFCTGAPDRPPRFPA